MITFKSTTLLAIALISTTSFATAQEFNLEIEGLNLTPSISDGFGDDDDIGAENSIRAKAGYTFANGAGVRLQVWENDVSYDEGQNGNPTEIELQQVDLIGFNEFEVTPGLNLELSAGIRKLEFADQNFTDSGSANAFDGIGGVFGVKVTQAVLENGGIYGSLESALLFGDATDGDNEDPQSNLSQTTIGLGYEHAFDFSGVTTTLKVGYEVVDFDGLEDNSDGAFGFDGVVFGAAIAF